MKGRAVHIFPSRFFSVVIRRLLSAPAHDLGNHFTCSSFEEQFVVYTVDQDPKDILLFKDDRGTFTATQGECLV